jgi:sporulation protein YlmC with PRC-barrel domain
MEHLGLADSTTAPVCDQASRLIGLEVRTETGERLGKVRDLIVSLEPDRAPFAIVKCGGALGLGGTRVAVPIKDIKLSDDHKAFTLAASKEQFEAASSTPSGTWAWVAEQDWAKKIDRFYGQPPALGMARFERHEMTASKQGRELVRDPAGMKGSEALVNPTLPTPPALNDPPIKPANSGLASQVTKLIEQTVGIPGGQDIQVTVEQGVVTLKGKVADADSQRKLQEQIKALPGVERVDDQLTIFAKEN